MIRKVLKILAGILVVVCAALVGLIAWASHAADRRHDVPLPPIRADRSPEGVARGAAIFHATCEACHRAPDSDRAAGAPLPEIPAWLGTFHSANITSHPEAGIGRRTDGEIARIIRYGVNRHGRKSAMPDYALSDADIAAVLGFLRSDDPLFRPDPRVAPPSELSALGKTVLFVTGALSPPDRPASGLDAPPRGPTAEYGRYLAEAVYDCGTCHTAGFAPDKVRGPDAFAGGFALTDAAGRPIVSANLTPDGATGIGGWTRDDLARALRDGFRPDGTTIQYPMPRFRGADDVEVDALFAFLQSLPPRANLRPGHRKVERRSTPPAPPADPAEQFVTLGCVACHSPGARYEANLANAAGKPALQVARWIRNPESFLPGTPMPTFASVLDEASALRLAEWIQSGGPRQVGVTATP